MWHKIKLFTRNFFFVRLKNQIPYCEPVALLPLVFVCIRAIGQIFEPNSEGRLKRPPERNAIIFSIGETNEAGDHLKKIGFFKPSKAITTDKCTVFTIYTGCMNKCHAYHIICHSFVFTPTRTAHFWLNVKIENEPDKTRERGRKTTEGTINAQWTELYTFGLHLFDFGKRPNIKRNQSYCKSHGHPFNVFMFIQCTILMKHILYIASENLQFEWHRMFTLETLFILYIRSERSRSNVVLSRWLLIFLL